MGDERTALDKIKGIVTEEISKKSQNNGVREEFLYTIPYKSVPITTPVDYNQLPIMLEDVVLVVKERQVEKDGRKQICLDLYTQDGRKIAETSPKQIDNGRMIFDKEIMDELIKDKIRMIKEAGYDVAGLGKDGNIETFFEMLGRKLVVMNEEQKNELENAPDRRRALTDISNDNMDAEVDDKNDRKLNTPQEQQQAMAQIQADVGIDVHKIVKIDPSDGAFWENNPSIKTRDAYAVLTDSGNLQIVGENNGKFEPVDGFENSSNETGRTTVIKNDTDDLSDNVKNTYGALYPTGNPNMRYTLELGQYGEIKLVEQIKVRSGVMENSDRYISREVATNNTNFSERNLEGNDNSENITIRTFRQRNGTNRDQNDMGHSNGRGGTSEIGIALKKHGNSPDMTMESFSADSNQRVDEAMRMVDEELDKRGIDLDSSEKEKLQERITAYVGNSEHVFCEEDAISYANEVQIDRRNEQEEKSNKGKEQEDEGRSRIEEAMARRAQGRM